MSNFNTSFVSLAVADYNVSHYWEFPQFQPGLLDLLRRNVTILNRIQPVPATGHPTRYKEQTKLPTNATFVDPRNGVAAGSYGLTSVNSDYGRVERAAMLKAMVSRINFTLFDKEVVQQQGAQEFLLAKDMNDMMVDMLRVQNNSIWNGTDTDLATPTTLDYMGILKQVTNAITISSPVVPTNATAATGDNYITDAICDQIAANEADLTWEAYPTALYANPITVQFINKQERFRKGNVNILNANTMDIGNGFKVPFVTTMRGDLPIIPEPYIGITGTTTKTHKIVGLNENLIERHYLTSPVPRVFKMSLNPTLVDDYVAVLFDTIIVKGVATPAHFVASFAI